MRKLTAIAVAALFFAGSASADCTGDPRNCANVHAASNCIDNPSACMNHRSVHPGPSLLQRLLDRIAEALPKLSTSDAAKADDRPDR